ncbi:MAG: hypothetical protein ACE15C_07815 [Phycisphaerae bacterium]
MTKRATLILATGILIAAGGAYTLAEGDDDAKAHEFKLPLKEGQAVPIVWKSSSVMKEHTGHGMAKTADLEMAAEMLLTAGKSDGKGGMAGTLAVTRVYGRAELMGQTLWFDNQRPESIRLKSGESSYAGRLTTAPSAVTLDASGKVTRHEPDAKLLKAIADSFKDTEDAKGNAEAVGKFLRNLADDPFAYFPGGPAKIDESWPVHKHVAYIDPSGLPMSIDEVSECKLVSVTPTTQGRVAKVEVSGKVVLPDKDKKTELAEYSVFGAMRVNLDSASAKWHVQLVAHVKDEKDDSDALNHTITIDVFTGDEAKAVTSRPASQVAAATQPASAKAAPP